MIEHAYRLLEKASQDARYEGPPFDHSALDRSRRLYPDIRTAMRRTLALDE